jgi:5-formyltetrahydrofolate cyclo-ligase
MDKNQLRDLYRKKRQALSREEVETYSVRIANAVLANFSFSAYKSVHIFLPIESRNEVNSWPIIERLRKKHPHLIILIPKIVGDEIRSFILKEDTLLVNNHWEIPEPLNAEEYAAGEIDLIFVPLLVYDERGHRVGYGKGYYDRFLKTCSVSVIKMGLSFFKPEPKISEDIYDVALDYCVTPDEIYSF